MVRFHPTVRCPRCLQIDFEPLHWDDPDGKFRCVQCGGIFARQALEADVIDLNSERRKREMRVQSGER